MDRLDEESEILERIGRGARIDHYETLRRRKDGSLVEISLTVSPIKNAEGRINIARDITERRRSQERQQLLIAETKHRIKNTLATVQSIAVQTLRSTSAEDHQAFVERLRALAGAHDLVTLESWNRASVHDVVCRALEAFQEDHRERFLTSGTRDVWLNASKSLLLAMALYELGTNAVKYGALSNDRGSVCVQWELLQGAQLNRVKLCWCERGGPPVKPPEHKGFGSLLLERALEGGLGVARLVYAPQGLICTLEVAL